MKKVYLFFILMGACALLNAQSLDSIVKQAATNLKSNGATMGLSDGIIKNDHSYFYHFGNVKKGALTMPNNQTIYEIGSVTKAFTSLLFAEAVLEHKVK